jgi:carbonic anhydrase
MDRLKPLLVNNRAWAERVTSEDPDFFNRLATKQSPEHLWIGCSDSRVPANQVVDLLPGEMFVHRNVANMVIHTDLNCLTVLQYAVEVLKVKHVIVCGHYGCGGITAALKNQTRQGLIDNWLCHIKDVYWKHEALFAGITDEKKRNKLLCELNVIEQAANICRTTVLGDAWEKGQDVSVHGWIYDVHDGLICDLNINVSRTDNSQKVYQQALATLTKTESESAS